jgi:hypothetical protein
MENLKHSWVGGGRGVEASWNVMAYAQRQDFVFRRNGEVYLNRRGRQFSRLAAEVCASAVVMLDTPRSEVVWRVLATHSIRHFPLHFPSLPLRHRVPSHFNRTPLTSLGCDINKRCGMCKAGNLESARMDRVGEGQGQMPSMRKGGESIPLNCWSAQKRRGGDRSFWTSNVRISTRK